MKELTCPNCNGIMDTNCITTIPVQYQVICRRCRFSIVESSPINQEMINNKFKALYLN